MHIRERGAGVQLIRTVYDKETKRPKQEMIGRFRRNSLKAPEDVAKQLTAEEKTELEAYFDRVRNLNMLRRKLAAHSLLENVTEAVEHLRTSTDEVERDLLRQQFAQAIILLRRNSASREPAASEEAADE